MGWSPGVVRPLRERLPSFAGRALVRRPWGQDRLSRPPNRRAPSGRHLYDRCGANGAVALFLLQRGGWGHLGDRRAPFTARRPASRTGAQGDRWATVRSRWRRRTWRRTGSPKTRRRAAAGRAEQAGTVVGDNADDVEFPADLLSDLPSPSRCLGGARISQVLCPICSPSKMPVKYTTSAEWTRRP